MDAKKQEDWAKALELFKQAREFMPHWMVVANLGEAELMIGRSRDAAENLDWALEEASKTKNDVSALQILQDKLDQAKAKVVTVQLKVGDAGVDLYVDGVFVGKSPMKRAVYVEPGRRLFEGRWGSGQVVKEEIEFAKGGMSREVRLGDRKDAPIHQEERDKERRAPAWVFGVGGGVGGIGLGMGVGFLLLRKQAAEDADLYGNSVKARGTQEVAAGKLVCADAAFVADCKEHERLKSLPNTYKTGAIVAFSVGGALVLGTVALAVVPPLVWKKKASTGLVDVSPIVGTRYQGMQVSGAF